MRNLGEVQKEKPIISSSPQNDILVDIHKLYWNEEIECKCFEGFCCVGGVVGWIFIFF